MLCDARDCLRLLGWLVASQSNPRHLFTCALPTTNHHQNPRLASSPLLAHHAGPLPLFQIQENLGDGKDKSVYRLWDVSPFDMSVMDGNLHASFPTALLGTDAGDTSGTCAVNLDNIG
jgi:hypothetical protein